MVCRKANKRLLIVSYPFPPIPYSGSYRMLRMCKGLTKLGVEVHVLTIRVDERIPNDLDLLNQVPKSVKVHRTKILDPWLSFQQWRTKKGHSSSTLERLISGFMRLITIPDHQILWIPTVVRQARRVIKHYGIKNVLVTSPPVSTLLSGLLIKKITGARFLADLRDPIVGNVAQVNLIDPTDIISKFEKNLLCKIEKVVIKNADVVIANTETHSNELKAKYGQVNNICFIRNCFDDDDYKGVNREKYAKFTISHIGSMYGLRKADVLFKAIKFLEAEQAPEPLNLQVLFVGPTDGNLERSILEYGVQRYVKVLPPVPHKRAIEIMSKSHLLLLIKAFGNEGYGQIPAKFFEYIGSANKILYIGPDKTEVTRIIARLACGACFEADDRRLCRFLVKEYGAYLNPLISVHRNKSTVLYDYSLEMLSQKIRNILD